MKIIYFILIVALFCLQGCAVTPPILKASESNSYFEDGSSLFQVGNGITEVIPHPGGF
jgi:hypothetical protein